MDHTSEKQTLPQGPSVTRGIMPPTSGRGSSQGFFDHRARAMPDPTGPYCPGTNRNQLLPTPRPRRNGECFPTDFTITIRATSYPDDPVGTSRFDSRLTGLRLRCTLVSSSL